jgi:hypothetical protein
MLDRLEPSEQESMLAHELAHHVRRDPAWLAVAHLLERVFFFQPLNGVACRRLRKLAELHCDAWAAEQTGDRLTLARCLAEVAGWIVQQRAEPALMRVMGMAGSPSALRQRIMRLLDDAAPSPARARRVRRSFIVLGPALLAAMVWVMPTVAALSKDAEPTLPERPQVMDGPGQSEIASPGEEGAALLNDLDVLDEEIAALRRVANRMPPDLQWADVMNDLTLRARALREQGERIVSALAGAPKEAAPEPAEDDQLDY